MAPSPPLPNTCKQDSLPLTLQGNTDHGITGSKISQGGDDFCGGKGCADMLFDQLFPKTACAPRSATTWPPDQTYGVGLPGQGTTSTPFPMYPAADLARASPPGQGITPTPFPTYPDQTYLYPLSHIPRTRSSRG